MRGTALLITLIAAAGCGDDAADSKQLSSPKTEELSEASINTPSGWWIRIRRDGSGSVGYGSNGMDSAGFGRDTLDFTKIREQIQAVSSPKGKVSTHFTASFRRGSQTSATGTYFTDAALAKRIFDRALAGMGSELFGDHVGKLSKIRPPVPDTGVKTE